MTYGKVDVVITADESCMHDYHLSFMAGFIACVPKDRLPGRVQSYVEDRFFKTVPHENGEARLALLPLRKLEAVIKEMGFSCVVAPPQVAEKFEARLFLVSTMDPFGIGPASTTMVGLAGGKEPYNKYFFERLIKKIKARRPGARIVVGGPGVWEFDILKGEQSRLGIDTIYSGDSEGLPKHMVAAALSGKELPTTAKAEGYRLDPVRIRKPTFWGMTEISRGCGRGCKFCDFELMSGVKWLLRDHILNEVRVNVECDEVKTITLLSEDVLRYGTKVGDWKTNHKVVELVRDIRAMGKPISLTHCCLASALSNPEVTEDFAYHAGFHENRLSGFQTGIETGSPRMMRKIMLGKCKPWTPEEWPEVVDQGFAISVDNYMIPHATLVMGMAEERPEDTVMTTELIDDLNHYPSLILPLFFVPLSILKDRPFVKDMLTPEQKDLLVACTSHTAKWARKLPNWSGKLGGLDHFVFAVGSTYCLETMKAIKNDGDISAFALASIMMQETLGYFKRKIAGDHGILDYYKERVKPQTYLPFPDDVEAYSPPQKPQIVGSSLLKAEAE